MKKYHYEASPKHCQKAVLCGMITFFFFKYQYEAPPKHCQKAVLCGEKTAEAEASLSGLLLFLFYFISCKALYAL